MSEDRKKALATFYAQLMRAKSDFVRHFPDHLPHTLCCVCFYILDKWTCLLFCKQLKIVFIEGLLHSTSQHFAALHYILPPVIWINFIHKVPLLPFYFYNIEFITSAGLENMFAEMYSKVYGTLSHHVKCVQTWGVMTDISVSRFVLSCYLLYISHLVTFSPRRVCFMFL